MPRPFDDVPAQEAEVHVAGPTCNVVVLLFLQVLLPAVRAAGQIHAQHRVAPLHLQVDVDLRCHKS
jgi:hypothetical protein